MNLKTKIKQEADENNKELKRLQFYGAGPKMAGYNVGKKEEKPKGKSLNYEFDPVSENLQKKMSHVSPLLLDLGTPLFIFCCQ